MSKLKSLLLFVFTLSHIPGTFAGTPENTQLAQQIHEDSVEYQSLVEQALAYREVTLQTYRQIKNNFEQDIPLSGNDIENLNTGILEHLALRKKLYTYTGYYEYLLYDNNPDINDATRLKGVMLSLSAALVLYDNYLLSISIFEEDTKLRRYINSKHTGYNIKNAQLSGITSEYNSLGKRNLAHKAIEFFETNWENQNYDFQHQPYNLYLYLLIKQSPSYNHILKFSPFKIFNQQTKYFTGITRDTLSDMSNNGVNLFSLLFGNSIGMIEVRKGLLKGNIEAHNNISMKLKAGDILLEKTPFRLTDKLIPGYWGHVAIWVGTEAELKQLEIWKHPIVKKYHQRIRAGKYIAEALRSGVELNSLQQFMNVDDLAILRKNNLGDENRAKTIIRTLRQIGKSYDFNFDIETNDKIVCSELIYVSFTDTHWPTDSALGRYTISPSNIAEKAGDNLPFKVVSLYLDGKPVTNGINAEFSKLN